MKTKLLLLTCCLLTFTPAFSAACKSCKARGFKIEKTVCDYCNGKGYTIPEPDRYSSSFGRQIQEPTKCPKCSKGVTRSIQLYGKNYLVGSGECISKVTCYECNGTGYVVDKPKKQQDEIVPAQDEEGEDLRVITLTCEQFHKMARVLTSSGTVTLKKSGVKIILKDHECVANDLDEL